MEEASFPSRLRRPVLALAGIAALGAMAWRRGVPSRAIRRAFDRWRMGTGSIYQLMNDDGVIVIPGSAPHCGTFRKDVFLRDTATPFVARFTKPPVPRLRGIWGSANGVIVQADATGTTRDGRSYANDYIFVFETAGPRVTRVTEYLDMAAFNAVWDRIEPSEHD